MESELWSGIRAHNRVQLPERNVANAAMVKEKMTDGPASVLAT